MRQRSVLAFIKLKNYRGGLAKLKMPIFLKLGFINRGRKIRRLRAVKLRRKRSLTLLSRRMTNLLMSHGKKSLVLRKLEALKFFYYTAANDTYYWYSRYPFEHLLRYSVGRSRSYIDYHKLKQGSAKLRLVPRFRSFSWGCRFAVRSLAYRLKSSTFKRSLGFSERINLGFEHLLNTECSELRTTKEDNRRQLREARYNRHFRWWRE